jgi:hypothetical protein
MSKKVWAIIAAIGISFGGWWLVKTDRVSFLSGTSNGKASGVVHGVSDLIQNAKNTVTNFISSKKEGVQDVSQTIKKQGEDLVQKEEQTITEKFQQAMGNAYNSVVDEGRNLLGIATSMPHADIPEENVSLAPSAGASPFFLGAVVKRGEPLTLAVKEAFFEENKLSEILCDVQWGDGAKETKRFYAADETKFIAHTFAAAGEYTALFTFGTEKSTIKYELTVLVRN